MATAEHAIDVEAGYDGDALGFVQRQVRDDIEHFKQFVESRGTESGAWRGEVQRAPVQGEPTTTMRNP
ncbi:MAG TPA: hypothetical protein VKU60_11495 [Chloroflexota bacterium]|nr:hypothetical protein [Chloroflexota bacterium]